MSREACGGRGGQGGSFVVYHLQLLDILPPTQRQLGPSWDEWYEFHRTSDHSTKECKLIATWAILLGEWRTKSELWMIMAGEIGVGRLSRIGSQQRAIGKTPPHQGMIATIAGGGSMAKMSSATRKRCSRSVLAVQERPTQRWDPQIKFFDEDYEGRISYSDDPMVNSVVIAGYKVERLGQRLVLVGFLEDGLFGIKFGGVSRNADWIRG
ncbi:hypothetical protein CR513_36807, partial [Mucuna pruriens]